MSESKQPTPAGAAGGARYSRSTGGLVGAMLVTVLVVLAFVGFRALTSGAKPTPVRAVDYAAIVKSARADGDLVVQSPARLPLGWKATSATYEPGASPTWHLGMLTSDGKYVGVEEARSSIEDLATEHVDEEAERGKDIVIDGETWQTWTDSGGDYAVGRSLQADGKPTESWLVVGTAPPAQVRGIASALEGASAPAAG